MTGSQIYIFNLTPMNAKLCVYMHMLLSTSYFPLHFLLYICLLSSLEGHKLREDRDFILFNALNFVDSYCFVK